MCYRCPTSFALRKKERKSNVLFFVHISFFFMRERKKKVLHGMLLYLWRLLRILDWCPVKFLMTFIVIANFFSQKLAETRAKVKKSLADDMDTVRAFDAVLELIALGNKELQTKPQVVRSSYKWLLSLKRSFVIHICVEKSEHQICHWDMEL